MSEANLSVPTEHAMSPGYSSRALGLAVVVSALTTTVVVFAVLQFLGVAPWSTPSLRQQGKIFTKGETMGIVYFETPYLSPPQVKVDASVDFGPGPVVKCKIVDQNELGFVWQLLLNGLPEPDRSTNPDLKANWQNWIKVAELGWESRGIKGRPGTAPAAKLSLPQDQARTVTVEGEDFLPLPKGDTPIDKVVHFKIAFLSPPYMTFPDGVAYGYKVTEQKADSFKIQRLIPREDRDAAKIEFPAKGGVVVGRIPPWEIAGGDKLKWRAEGQPAR